MPESYYAKGQWNALCARCGFRFKSGELRREWTGQRVCKKCYDPRHPMDTQRVSPERSAPKWTWHEGGESGA